MWVSLMNQLATPPQGRYRLSTLCIVLLHTLEFRRLNQIDLNLSGDIIGGSKELHVAQRIGIIITHGKRFILRSCCEE